MMPEEPLRPPQAGASLLRAPHRTTAPVPGASRRSRSPRPAKSLLILSLIFFELLLILFLILFELPGNFCESSAWLVFRSLFM